jgi:hypothetical protein
MTKNESTSYYIISLAKKHNITYKENNLDKFAKTITELSGDEVRQDDILDLIISLKRNGIISKEEVPKIATKYLRERNLK